MILMRILNMKWIRVILGMNKMKWINVKSPTDIVEVKWNSIEWKYKVGD